MMPSPVFPFFESALRQFQMTTAPVEHPTNETGLRPWTLFDKMCASSSPASFALFVQTDQGLSTKFVALKTAAGRATAERIPLNAVSLSTSPTPATTAEPMRRSSAVPSSFRYLLSQTSETCSVDKFSLFHGTMKPWLSAPVQPEMAMLLLYLIIFNNNL